MAQGGCRAPLESAPEASGHLVENVRLFSAEPERFGQNAVQGPFHLGADSEFRNSYVFGHFEHSAPPRSDWLLPNGTRIIGNTFIWYQQVGAPISLQGAQDVTIANNVFVSLSRQETVMFNGDPRNDWTHHHGKRNRGV